MTQPSQFGDAELDAYARVDRADGSTEYFHIVDGTNVPITAVAYATATQEN